MIMMLPELLQKLHEIFDVMEIGLRNIRHQAKPASYTSPDQYVLNFSNATGVFTNFEMRCWICLANLSDFPTSVTLFHMSHT
jgi:hypothetical protein